MAEAVLHDLAFEQNLSKEVFGLNRTLFPGLQIE